MLGLAPTLLSALKRAGLTQPTPIQNQAIPLALQGHDVLGLAQTGTGKTLAFGLPLVDHLLAEPGKPAPRTVKALILAPTRELVNQIADSLRILTAGTKVRVVTVVGGIGLALLLDQPFFGQGIVRVLMISPFFIMPTVSSMVWKNLIMHPVFGLFAEIQHWFGVDQGFDWFGTMPLFSVGMIVSWQWLPFAALILLTSLQSLDSEQKDAALMDGAKSWAYFRHIILPHLARPIAVVVMIETIFILNTFAEIKVTTVGGLAGNLTYLVYSQLNDANDVGAAAAGGVLAIILANIVTLFLVRLVGKNLEG